MKGKMIVYYPGEPPELKVTEYSAPIPLEDLQQAVGGDIETVPYWDSFPTLDGGPISPAVVWCHGTGKLEGLPRNRYMTDLWEKHLQGKGMSRFDKQGKELDFLVGKIVVTTGDAEFMAEL